MKDFTIMLASIDDVKQFVNAATMQDCDIDLISGRYIVDAKSIMGIFSLDLSKPIGVEVRGEDDQAEAFSEIVKKFIV